MKIENDGSIMIGITVTCEICVILEDTDRHTYESGNPREIFLRSFVANF